MGSCFNDDAEDERAARRPSTSGTTHRQASPSSDRGRLARRRRRKSRRSPQPASSAPARSGPARARATRRRRCRSNGSPPQTCHRRFAFRSPPCCHARDARTAPPNAGGHGPAALRVQRELSPGRDRWRAPISTVPPERADQAATGRTRRACDPRRERRAAHCPPAAPRTARRRWWSRCSRPARRWLR
jgi:hypothetical protein